MVSVYLILLNCMLNNGLRSYILCYEYFTTVKNWGEKNQIYRLLRGNIFPRYLKCGDKKQHKNCMLNMSKRMQRGKSTYARLQNLWLQEKLIHWLLLRRVTRSRSLEEDLCFTVCPLIMFEFFIK